MTIEESPLPERVAKYYSQLQVVAADLNSVSDQLGKSISEIDSALKILNLGISVWVKIHGGEGGDSGSSFWRRDIGYSKIDGKWGISLRKVEGYYDDPEEEALEQWLFNDAPRSLRLEAIEKIPALLEELSTQAVKTTKDIQARLAEAQAVATAVKDAARSSTTKRPLGRMERPPRAEAVPRAMTPPPEAKPIPRVFAPLPEEKR